jgi:RecA/RadA recombinase
MSALMDKIKKNTTIMGTAMLKESKIFGNKDMITTPVPMINVALGGDIDGGLTPGLTVLAGPSKHFKTLFALVMGAAFLKKYEDGVVLFYDSEFGTPIKYFESLNIDMSRVVHTPITDIELLKQDIMVQLKGFDRKDKVMIIVDSVGNLASRKEVDDALDGKTVVDMTRAKAMKSLFRMVTPHLTIKDIPMVTINHTYQTMEMFSKAVVSGGTGIYYSADTIWIIGRQQDKDDKTKQIDGYHFIINIEKSRYVREKSKIPISVSYEKGINKWSGFLELALEAKVIGKPIAGRYERIDADGVFFGPRYKEDDIISNDAFWEDVLETTHLREWIKEKYSVAGAGSLIQNSLEEVGEDE